jgi:hypothetical protein
VGQVDCPSLLNSAGSLSSCGQADVALSEIERSGFKIVRDG